MRNHGDRPWQLWRIFFYAWLWAIALATVSIAEEKPTDAGASAEPAAVGKTGGELFEALITSNQPPRVYRSASGYVVALFPKNFDWKEYYRVRDAIHDLEANAEKEWPHLVEHMTDPEYCFTAERYDSAYNQSRGKVCYEIARNWVNRGYVGLMPMDRPLYQYQAPNDMKPEELQKWCRERRDKQLYEVQIEAAEWALSIIPEKSDMDKEMQDISIAEIQKRIATLRETRKARRGSYFIPDAVCPYTEERAGRK